MSRLTTITVINNDTDFLTLMNELLTAHGWSTTVCRESGNAYQTVKREQPDLVILDIRMESPESGWVVLDVLMLDPLTRSIPVIVCSAAALQLRDKEDWLQKHGVFILLKPFNLDDLYAMVERALELGPRDIE